MNRTPGEGPTKPTAAAALRTLRRRLAPHRGRGEGRPRHGRQALGGASAGGERFGPSRGLARRQQHSALRQGRRDRSHRLLVGHLDGVCLLGLGRLEPIDGPPQTATQARHQPSLETAATTAKHHYAEQRGPACPEVTLGGLHLTIHCVPDRSDQHSGVGALGEDVRGGLVVAVTGDDHDVEVLTSHVEKQLESLARQNVAGIADPAIDEIVELVINAPDYEELVARTRALMRAKARAEATYGRMVKAVASATGLDRDRSERALFVATCMLCQRLTPEEAQHLVAQLPSLLQPQLEECLTGPDRSVTTRAIEDKLASSLGLPPETASESLRAVLKVIAESVSAGQIAEVRGQLPEEMKALLPATA